MNTPNPNGLEEAVAEIVCIPRSETPSVPSIEVECHECHDELWLSEGMAAAMPDAIPVCFACMVRAAADSNEEDVEILLHPSQREVMREHGYSDEQIDNAVKLGHEVTQMGVDIVKGVRRAESQ